ncbi:MAG: potassium transporter TrkA [Thermoplasmata archaeon HGW-Thermoplasmata-1]|nr:MAG: potassium transporter TrkA [Thermoplasmata archaeon HGW-Thermoplasmata-1]
MKTKEKNPKRQKRVRTGIIPKWKKAEFEEVEYEPTSVKELLTEMKDISELILGLAYSAALYDSIEIAEEVKYLEVRMDKMNYQIRMIAMLAARTKEDAEQLAGILQLAEAAESISNAAADIASLALSPMETKSTVSSLLRRTDEVIRRVRVDPESHACGKTIGELNVESETGVRVLAIRRKSKNWIYGPDDETKILAEDSLIVRGPDSGWEALQDFLHAEMEVLD